MLILLFIILEVIVSKEDRIINTSISTRRSEGRLGAIKRLLSNTKDILYLITISYKTLVNFILLRAYMFFINLLLLKIILIFLKLLRLLILGLLSYSIILNNFNP
ncbi:hypothetical protein EDB81DRAFT_764830 [Dactylonectria macrodidyma]|uniref:Uncharacterized protein n=1 Tax=Dactylonectria macrodidyma TaxID=307937 RepID=A0A9P9DZ01_9HYPO|nr:hypothetical protein EDB81DRAFT_764830 [Dactylonectria macrodidyma]